MSASLLCAPAQGALPRTNGAIAYVVSNGAGIPHLESSYLTGAPSEMPLAATGVDRGGDAFAPAWAPNGSVLAFASTRTGNTQIYTVQFDPAGQPLSAALPSHAHSSLIGQPLSAALPSHAHSSLIGQPLSAALPSQQSSVCGLEICRLTDDPSADSHPSWSPNGQQLVFESNRSGTEQIYTMSATGGEVRRLLCDGAEDTQPSWSQSGLIAFVSNRSGSDQIYVMNTGGGEVRQLTNQPGVNADPSWSPSGSELVYASGEPGDMQIFTVGVGGGHPKQLTHGGHGQNELPAWSPDGTEILVSHRNPASNTGYIYAIDAGSGQRLAHARIAGFEASWAPLMAAPTSAAPTSAAPPVVGHTAIVQPLSGTVTVDPGQTAPPEPAVPSAPSSPPRRSGSSAPSERVHSGTGGASGPPSKPAAHPTLLRGRVEIPVRSAYDATRGVVKLEVTVGRTAKPSVASAVVTGGRFSVIQPQPEAAPIVQLLGQPVDCGSGSGSASAASHRSQPRIKLKTTKRWVSKGGTGRAAARGTDWEVENTCEGTVYRTSEGDIVVTDPARHTTVVLGAGHSYLVRPDARSSRASSHR